MSSVHLTETDLFALIQDRPLNKRRGLHLDACRSCQKLVERLDAFDPKRGANEVIRAVRRGQIERPNGSVLVTALVLLVFVLTLFVVVTVVRSASLGQSLDFEEGRAKAAEKALGMVCSDYLALRARVFGASLPLAPIPELAKDRPICVEKSPR